MFYYITDTEVRNESIMSHRLYTKYMIVEYAFLYALTFNFINFVN